MSPSSNAEMVSECLAAVLDAVPLLDDDDRAHIVAQHPWATTDWLAGMQAMSSGLPTEDTKLIAQMMQQLQAQQLSIGMLEAERGNAVNGAAEPLSPRPTRQASPRPSPGGPGERDRARPPKARSGPRQDSKRPPQPPSQQPPELDGPSPQDRPPKPRAAGPKRGKAPSPAPGSSSQPAGSSDADDAGGDRDAEGKVPWNEFAEDDEGGVVQPADAEEAEEIARRRLARSESRFGSISEEIKALNSGLISEPSTVLSVDTRQPCPNCGRKFLPERLQRHFKVCEDMKRSKEWRGTWKSPHANEAVLTSSFKV